MKFKLQTNYDIADTGKIIVNLPLATEFPINDGSDNQCTPPCSIYAYY